MIYLKKFLFVYIFSNFIKKLESNSFVNHNFRRLNFCNYKQIKSFIFKKEFYKQDNKYVQTFDFLNFSKDMGGKIGINLSKESIFKWYNINKNNISFAWSEDYPSKRLINIIYNYEYINSSSTNDENKYLNKIITFHINRIIIDFNYKKINEISSYDLIGYYLSCFILNKINDKNIKFLNIILTNHIDRLGMHKSYNILEHTKYINNLNELGNIFLFYDKTVPPKLEETILKMRSILNEYFHDDGTFPLFNGSNNNYIKIVHESLKKEEYLKSRLFSSDDNGIAFYRDSRKKIFFDVVQPNKDRISNSLSAGTLSFEFSCCGEKIITNCGASESFGKNPEYLRYSAAHSTIVLQNTNISEIKENNPHVKFPQLVKFDLEKKDNKIIFEGLHNGYAKRFNKILKRRLEFSNNKDKITGKDTIISIKNSSNRIVYHIRFHLVDGVSFNFTNNKKNIILKSKNKNMWLFKSKDELIVEDSILVDKNETISTKQIVIKGVLNQSKIEKNWSIEKL
tara:strand:+ start:15888 stop:17420 length:1533 start_codon:yes stop_codon:yes gene_type:complete